MSHAQSLRAAGVKQEDLATLAGDAMKVQRLLVNNPHDLSFDDALALYQAAF